MNEIVTLSLARKFCYEKRIPVCYSDCIVLYGVRENWSSRSF
jgi:hypothetical protein